MASHCRQCTHMAVLLSPHRPLAAASPRPIAPSVATGTTITAAIARLASGRKAA
jgi:hypothetical protein